MERFSELLNHLQVTVEDMDDPRKWATLLMDTIGQTHHLSHWYWELLVELVVLVSQYLELDFAHGLQAMTFLTEAKEWNKLECCMGIVWMLSPREASEMAEGDLVQSTLLLFHRRPGAVQKLERWMERWGRGWGNDIPESFKQICKQGHEDAQQDTSWVPFYTHRMFSGSHARFRFVVGRFHPPVKQLKNPLLHHHPSLPHCLEVIGSGSRWRTVSPNASMVWQLSPLISYF